MTDPEVVHHLKLRSVFGKFLSSLLPPIIIHLVEWAIALHGMYESTLVFIAILK